MISVLSFGKCGERGSESLTYSQNAKTRLLSLLCPSSGLIEPRLKVRPPIGPSHADAQARGPLNCQSNVAKCQDNGCENDYLPFITVQNSKGKADALP